MWKRKLGGAVGTLSAVALAVVGLAVPAETAAAAEDVTPPVVTGTLVTEPNESGWYNGDVTVTWTAVDAEPSSGLVGEVPDTQVTGEGADLTATSEPVCDAAGNCATGEVGGINIDRTTPTLAITGVEDGATYQLGAVPSAACEATDALAGVAGECTLTGYGTDLGSWTVTAEATDAAGNTGSTSVGYTVTASAARVTGTVRDQSGNLLPGTAIDAREAGTANLVASTVANADGVYSLTRPAGTYDFTITGPAGTGLGARVHGREIPAGVTTIDWTIGLMTVRLSGVVSDGVETANYGMLRFYDVNGVEAGQAEVEADGSWEAYLVPGSYQIHFWGSSPRMKGMEFFLPRRVFDTDTVVDVRPTVNDVFINLSGPDGQPASGRAEHHPHHHRGAGRPHPRFPGTSDRLSHFYFEMAPRVFGMDTVVDVRPVVTEVAVHLLGADGGPASAWAEMVCNFRLGPPHEGLYQYVTAVAYDSGRIALLGVPTPEGATCQLRIYPDDGPDITRSITVTADGPNDITLFTFGTGLTFIGDPGTSNDGDNVADAIEAFAPNGGDGNNDGVPDYEQSNVTSLPVLGGVLGGGTVYVTVAVPDGASLTNVYTIDPADETQVATPPPAGVTLPEGLTKFIVEGVEVGSSQKISIHTSSTAGLAGYAKYDVSAGEWSLLGALCGTSTVEDPVEFTTTGTTSLRYDDDGGAFIQNWKTLSLPGSYLVSVETDDGSSVSAEFKLK